MPRRAPSTSGGTPSSLGVELKDHLDFSQVGLIGHSRGGEGVRAAYNLYRDSGSAWPARILAPVAIRVISEIAPVDGQTSRVLNADGTSWSVLLPLCDGDVANLQGIKPFDRMMRISSEPVPRQKAALAVWGANHNFYNTEWQVSDSSRCTAPTPLFLSGTGSVQQQSTAAHPVLALMRANLGGAADAAFNKLFPSRFALPAAFLIVTPIERSFQDSASSLVGIVLDDFDKPTGTSSAGAANEANGVAVQHGTAGNRHDPGQRAAALTWKSASASTYFQSNFTAAGAGRDVSAYAFVNLRAARQVSTLNPATPLPTSFKIQLVDADGNRSAAVALSTHLRLTGPVGGPGGTHILLQSAQISSFGTFALTKVRGVRLVFDETASGAIYVSNIRFSNSQVAALLRLAAEERAAAEGLDDAEVAARVHALGLTAAAAPPPAVASDIYFAGIRRAPPGENGGAGDYELELRSPSGFPVRNELAVLRVGERELGLSR